MQKAPLTEAKQIEHVLNERKLLGAAKNQFCVRLEHAFQDKKHLYLLQEWIPGENPMPHLLDYKRFSTNEHVHFAYRGSREA